MHPDRIITTNIQLLRSSIASKRPVANNLLDGQAAINTNATEPGLYFKLTDNNLVKIGPVALSSNGDAPNSSPGGSPGNATGETWLDSRASFGGDSILKVFNGASWIPANGFGVDDATGEFELENVLTVQSLIADGTGDNSHITVPRGNTTTRPSSPIRGMIRYNTSSDAFEGYQDGSWTRFAVQGGDTTINDLQVNGNTTLGNDCTSDTLTVTAVTSIECDITIGTNQAHRLTVNARVNSDLEPATDSTHNLGSTSRRWANLYTGDLHLKNERGDWTMIEEEDYLSLRNNKTGKIFRLVMEEV